ncbi:putative DNA-directed RNA polymerase II subunit RPB9 [Cladorrhinum sp. PSN332]|nr:putative DNA-directed RNA polymerase II subunit RPB9 [Cladorrhinum sp. PSN332]
MSSPAAPSSPGQEQAKKPFEQITFRFCSECSNMLYPREDDVNRQLMFVCRTCNYSEKATTACIYRNILNNAAGETAGVTQDVGSDPTLPRSKRNCPVCNHGECVYFQSQQRTSETGMKLFYVCCECGEIFQ